MISSTSGLSDDRKFGFSVDRIYHTSICLIVLSQIAVSYMVVRRTQYVSTYNFVNVKLALGKKISRLLVDLSHLLTNVMTRTDVGFAQAWSVPGYTATVTHSSCNGTLGRVLAISTRFFAVDPIISFLTFCNA